MTAATPAGSAVPGEPMVGGERVVGHRHHDRVLPRAAERLRALAVDDLELGHGHWRPPLLRRRCPGTQADARPLARNRLPADNPGDDMDGRRADRGTTRAWPRRRP